MVGVLRHFEYANSSHIMPETVKSFLVRPVVYKGNYSFRINITEEIFEIRSCIEISANYIKIYAIDQY